MKMIRFFSISRKHILADNFTKLLTERGFICPKNIYIMAPAIVSYVKSFWKCKFKILNWILANF